MQRPRKERIMLVNLSGVLKDAREGRYAVGLFNTTDTDMLEAVISAAEELESPVIIGTAEVLLPYGELKLIAPAMIAAAKRAKVPVVVHFDHGLTFGRCMEALDLGFSSIMFDGSLGSFRDNIAQTAEMVRLAHGRGATVEGEIGHVGEASGRDNENTDGYTRAADALEFAEKTGVDALAVAIGTAHGTYKTKPRLDFERLAGIREAVDVPLVLHGGSGLSDEDFRKAIAGGISKINIFTDLCAAGERAMRDGIGQKLSYLGIRENRVRYIKEAVEKKIRLFKGV